MSNQRLNITVARIKRLQNTKSGNPRWKITSTSGNIFWTKPDSQDAGVLTGTEEGKTLAVEVENNFRIVAIRLRGDRCTRCGSDAPHHVAYVREHGVCVL